MRCLFLDLHLVDGQAGTDQRRHYGVIASILEDNISQNGGPFILVIWTEHERFSNELRDYLDTNLDQTKPHARPLAVLGLAKERFINTGDLSCCLMEVCCFREPKGSGSWHPSL